MNRALADLLCARYPCINEPLGDMEVPVWDNLYINLSRAMRSCSLCFEALRNAVEVEMDLQAKVFELIERIFALVMPSKVFFVAMDGVCPLAKVAKDKEHCFVSWKQGESTSDGSPIFERQSSAPGRFDLNCITAGTVFAEKLQKRLKRYFHAKMNSDPFWSAIEVIYSGYDCPGDGEQKILSYIRSIRAKSGYNPSTRHCMYGLDTNLILLGLATHEPNFALIYDTPFYGRESHFKSVRAHPMKSYLLDLCLLRQYLFIEFDKLRRMASQVMRPLLFNFERCLDDWIFLVCLSGDDSVPCLNNVTVELLPQLWASYMKVFDKLQGYLNEEGQLNLHLLEVYFEKLSKIDRDDFVDKYDDLLWLRSKSSLKTAVCRKVSLDQWCSDFWSGCTLSTSSESKVPCNGYSEGWDKTMDDEFLKYRIDYYMDKFDLSEFDPSLVENMKVNYLHALQWTLKYYYEGIVSWRWFYPFHYTPFITDLKGLQDVQLNFAKDSPLLPFQYMLAVLPSTSSHLVPSAYQDRLVEIAQRRDCLLTFRERERNQRGCCLLYKCLPQERQTCISVPVKEFDLSPVEVVHGLLPDAKELLSSFTAFERLKFQATVPALPAADSPLKPLVVSVIGKKDQVERGMVSFSAFREMVASEMASSHSSLMYRRVKLNGSVTLLLVVYHFWRKAALHCRYAYVEGQDGRIAHSKHDMEAAQDWKRNAGKLEGELRAFKAIRVNEARIIVHCRFPAGVRFTYEADGSRRTEFRFEAAQERFLYDTVVPEVDVDKFFLQRFEDGKELLTYGSPVFSLAKETYGQQGIFLCRLSGDKLRVRLASSCERMLHADLSSLTQQKGDDWVGAYQLSTEIKMPKNTILRLTGRVPLLKSSSGRADRIISIGLNLRFTKSEICMPGYAIKAANGHWLYSRQTTLLLIEYRRKFPEVVEAIGKYPHKGQFQPADIWLDDEREDRMVDLVSWLFQLPINSIRPEPCAVKVVDISIRRHMERIDRLAFGEDEFSTVDVRDCELYYPSLVIGKWPPDLHDDYRLFDRVVCVRACLAVPLGMTGTVIQLPPSDQLRTSNLLVLFDHEFTGAFRPDGCMKSSAFYVPADVLVNISHGIRRLSLYMALSLTAVLPKTKRIYLNNTPRLRFKSDVNVDAKFIGYRQPTDFDYNVTTSSKASAKNELYVKGSNDYLVKDLNNSAADYNVKTSSVEAVFNAQELDIADTTTGNFEIAQTDELFSTNGSALMATNSTVLLLSSQEHNFDLEALETIYTDGSGQ
ncbi:XRN 5'-3' exonuclease [Trichuris suis]|nr:XRN 5'-3' exonuclease [Trichuris suis]